MWRNSTNLCVHTGRVFFVVLGLGPSEVAAQEGIISEPSMAPVIQEITSGVQVCNGSSVPSIRVAISHFSEDKWTNEGWWKVDLDRCAIVLGEIRNRYMYYYAHGSGVEWAGDYVECTSSSPFEITEGRCPANAEYFGFDKLDLEGSNSFTLTLTN